LTGILAVLGVRGLSGSWRFAKLIIIIKKNKKNNNNIFTPLTIQETLQQIRGKIST